MRLEDRTTNRFDWVNDGISGVVVFLVALPLCLGIALASNAPLMSGIVAGIVGGLVVGWLSGSHTSVSGPAAGLTAVVAAQIATLGSFEAFLAALIVAGLVQIAIGVARFGFISAFFPSSVIKGLLAAIGVILVLKQLPHLVGWDMDANGEMSFWQPDQENTISEIGKMFFNFHFGATLVGLGSLALLLGWDKVPFLKKSKVPPSLIVVAFGVSVSFILSSFGAAWVIDGKHLVQVPVADSLNGFLSFLYFPDFSKFLSPSVYFAGITIACVASLETLLNLDAIDKIDPKQRTSPANRELIAQGIGNTLLGFIGGLPVTSVVIRGSVNINAGAQSRLSTIFHGALLAVCVLFFPYVINTIPLACLAAILIVTGLKLASQKIAMQMWNQGLNQFIPFIVTVLAIVFTDLLVGVLVGLATSVVFILHSNLKRPIHFVEEQHFSGQVRRVILANQVSFLNRAALQLIFDKTEPGGHLLLDGTQTDYIDADILALIIDFRDKTAPARDVTLSLVGFKKSYKLENHIQYTEHSTDELQKELSAGQVLQILKDGNERVRRGERLRRDLGRQIAATSGGQFPLGVVLSCMDSRAPVELIFDLGIGDVFSTRIAGHTISPKVLGSLEFACAVAGAKLIVVMGHTQCGAVSAAIEDVRLGSSVSEITGCEHLGFVVSDIKRVVKQNFQDTIPLKGTPERQAFEDKIVEQNVIECMDGILNSSKKLNRLLAEGSIAMMGCVYDVRSGNVQFVREINHAKLVEVRPMVEERAEEADDMGNMPEPIAAI